MLYLVRSTTNVLGGLKRPNNPDSHDSTTHETRIYPNLMANLGHEHIFMTMLASVVNLNFLKLLYIKLKLLYFK
jgi:hypothetical protein